MMAEISDDPAFRSPLPDGDDWVIVAPSRSHRPNAFYSSVEEASLCPFCPGNEKLTPAEIVRRCDVLPWSLRVFPNKYPAVREGGSSTGNGGDIGAEGAHELIVETPDHFASIDELPAHLVTGMLETFVERYRVHSTRYHVTIFRNSGPKAGASIEHPHSQLLATAYEPPRTARERRALTALRARSVECPCCEIASSPNSHPELIERTDTFALVAPHASRMPYQQWIVPVRHAPDFTTMTRFELSDLARLVQTSIRAMKKCFGEPSYNWAIVNFKGAHESVAPCHWYFEILPRLTNLAGFELATGSFINIVDPVRAATELREGIRQ